MKLRAFVLASAVILAVTACSASGTPAPSPAGSSSPVAQRIAVTLTDSFAMEPSELTVKAGQSVTFVVTNSGAIQHEFVIGDESAQTAHEEEMSAGGMAMDEPGAIVLKPGETRELTHVFATVGTSIAGCHEPGHYKAGMRAAITITG